MKLAHPTQPLAEAGLRAMTNAAGSAFDLLALAVAPATSLKRGSWR